MAYGMMRAAGKVAKAIKSATKSPGQRRRLEAKEILSSGNPISRMNDAAKKAFARKNLK
tara:strand:- start:1836 stop:2012 length:177 start_codon:yes stop_codon:yes gene_type:complete